ncbi:hypothetical protein OF83DRAFT_1160253 [Amylostereum chailletii]|nr:hypothetical protein OF83DRAFT_1160253 [Amylostereum chailletii]
MREYAFQFADATRAHRRLGSQHLGRATWKSIKRVPSCPPTFSTSLLNFVSCICISNLFPHQWTPSTLFSLTSPHPPNRTCAPLAMFPSTPRPPPAVVALDASSSKHPTHGSLGSIVYRRGRYLYFVFYSR